MAKNIVNSCLCLRCALRKQVVWRCAGLWRHWGEKRKLRGMSEVAEWAGSDACAEARAKASHGAQNGAQHCHRWPQEISKTMRLCALLIFAIVLW